MQKKLWIEIFVYSLLLVIFIYLDLKNEVPTGLFNHINSCLFICNYLQNKPIDEIEIK